MTCEQCGLPDMHHGQGDGIGSCDCPRCLCCRAAPGECDCARDWDELDDDPCEPTDWWCNDASCDHLQARLNRNADIDAERALSALRDAQQDQLAAILKARAREPFSGRPEDGWRELTRDALRSAGIATTDEQFERAWRVLWQSSFMGGNFTLDAGRVLAAIEQSEDA